MFFVIKIMDLYHKLIFHIHTKKKFLLCISGGQDSLALLKLILDMKQYYTWTLGLIYFDHHYRIDSIINLKQVVNICKIANIDLFVYESFTWNRSEQKNRNWRYNTVINIAHRYNYSTILLAHTLTDISEFFLQRVINASNLDNLNNFNLTLQTSSILNIMKPLLNVRRIETYWLCRVFCLPIWSDLTNYKCSQSRNRLRQEFVPYLQRFFQPKLEQKIVSFLQETQQDIEYLHKVTLRLYLLIKHPFWSAINYKTLLNQPLTLQSRTLKLFFKYILHKILSIQDLKLIIFKLNATNFSTCIYTSNSYKIFLSDCWLYAIII